MELGTNLILLHFGERKGSMFHYHFAFQSSTWIAVFRKYSALETFLFSFSFLFFRAVLLFVASVEEFELKPRSDSSAPLYGLFRASPLQLDLNYCHS